MSQARIQTSDRPPRRRFLLLRLLLASLATVILMPVLLLVGLLLGLQTETGRTLLGETIEQLASQPGRMEIAIGEIEGPLPHRLRVNDLRISDDEGTWLSLDQAELRWQPLKLLERRLQLDLVEVGHLELDRLPPPADTAPDQAAQPPEKIDLNMPELPLSLRLERLSAERISLGRAVLGTSAVLRVEGNANAERGGSLQTNLEVARIDGTRGLVQADLLYQPETRELTASVTAEEPQGGLIARALQIKGYPEVNLLLEGKGPVEAWNAHLTGEAGSNARIESRLAVVGLDPLRIDLDSTADLSALMPDDLQPLARPNLQLSLSAIRQSDGTLTISNGSLESQAAHLTFEGTLDQDGQGITAQAELLTRDAEVIEPFITPASFSEGQLHLDVSGTIAKPSVNLRGQLSGLSTSEAEISETRISMNLVPDRPLSDPEAKVDFELDLEATGIDYRSEEMGQTLSDKASLVASGRAPPSGQAFRLNRLRGDFGVFELDGQGGIDLESEESDLEITLSHPDLANFSGLLATPDISGAVTGRLTARQRPGDPLIAKLQLDLSGFSSGQPLADSLLGKNLRLAGRVEKPSDNEQLSGKVMLVSQGLSATIEGSGDLQAETLALDYSLDLPSLNPLSSSLGMPLDGALALKGTVQGDFTEPAITAALTSPSLNLAGNAFKDLDSKLDLALSDGRPSGNFLLQAQTDYGALAAQTDFDLQEDGILDLRNLSLTQGEDTRLTGNLGLPLDGTPAEGSLQGQGIQLSSLSELAGQQLSGTLDLDITLNQSDSQQGIVLESQLSDLRLGAPSAPDLSVQQTRLELNLSDALAAPTMDGTLSLAQVSARGTAMESLEARAQGPLNAIRLSLSGSGELDQPLTFTVNAEGDVTSETPAVRITDLEADYGDIPLRLQRPLGITYGQRLEIQDLALGIGNGRLTGGGALGPDNTDMEFALRDLPLELLEAIDPEFPLRGLAAADLRLQGASRNPQGRFDLRLSEVNRREEQKLGSLPELSGQVTAQLQDGQLQVNGSLSGFAEEALRLSGNLPVQLSLQPFAFELADSAPLEGQLSWSGNIENVVGLLPVDTIRLTGGGEVDMSLGGTLADPDFGGRIALNDAVYENFFSGTLLQSLNLVIEGRSDRLEITKLEASDGGNGTFSGQGSVQFRDGEELLSDLSLEFSNMGFVHRDDVTAHLSGNLSLQGDLLGQSELTGEIRNDTIEIRLVDDLPPSVTELNNVIILGQDEGNSQEETSDDEQEEEQSASSGPDISLDVEIDLPRRVFVRGRGLDSEWGGHFSVSGTAASPRVVGSLEPQRGSFSIAGKSFQLQEGSVSLPPGNDLNPTLDLSAATQAGDIQAIIKIMGTASSPEIKLTSNPILPEDEVLSRVLFNKNSSRLSPGEALMLANTAATLTSGGPGITDIARNMLGADVVSFTPGEEEDGGLGSVTVGRYLADGVFVGVEQGTQAGSTELDVELDVTNNIKVNSKTGSDGSSQVGIRWQWDY
ncbi:translocation/assembly module TamB domain-containing protein [Fodinicurvata fenggangensis]|uniref:translocation/assembly module TamB domain-containing protein n=1 Tax=Fodinicurvata fenggangensis TaxID=1121830 RepID=UPI00047B8CDC|nr:translocation/assembly module TamB domain-containing protein [Fodinicurvata fenggangensis]